MGARYQKHLEHKPKYTRSQLEPKKSEHYQKKGQKDPLKEPKGGKMSQKPIKSKAKRI